MNKGILISSSEMYYVQKSHGRKLTRKPHFSDKAAISPLDFSPPLPAFLVSWLRLICSFPLCAFFAGQERIRGRNKINVR